MFKKMFVDQSCDLVVVLAPDEHLEGKCRVRLPDHTDDAVRYEELADYLVEKFK